MIGEDSNTCMGIRARQKGSNRGLLSMLLHGNCRILGAKDCHGRLTARAVSRLLIDDITGLPVLYVETPYGSVDEESYVEVSIAIFLASTRQVLPLLSDTSSRNSSTSTVRCTIKQLH
jgi:hypothetical protein